MSSTSASDTMRNVTTSHWQDGDIAEKYKRGEAATGPYANIMVEKARLGNHSGDINALDLGCGTGALTAAFYDALPKEKHDDAKMLGTDISEGMLAYVRQRAMKEGWKGVETAIVDGNDIKLPPSTFTHIFSNFCIFMLPPTTTSTLVTLLKPSGFIGISSWEYLMFYTIVKRAVNALPNPPPYPSETELETTMYKSEPWQAPSYVKKVLEEAGCESVDVVVDEKLINCGTPEVFCEAMFMPLNMIGSFWEAGKREQLVSQVKDKLFEIVVEEFGKEGPVMMKFKGIVGTGRKPA